MKNRPAILTVAGFDPSGGAGILADIKTFEQHKCLGLAVQTANTVQIDDQFESVNWIDESLVMEQLQLLQRKYEFRFVKIGLIQSEGMLYKIIDAFKKRTEVKLIWDPILNSSSGFSFHTNFSQDVLRSIYMVTPNWEEATILGGQDDTLESAQMLSRNCYVLLKGGHRDDQPGKDLLYRNGESISFNPKPGNYFPKHGSGCVFSAAVTSNLALGFPVPKSILRAKRYVERFLSSTSALTGYHHFR